MKLLAILLTTLVAYSSHAQKNNKLQICKGRWLASLQLNAQDVLPFELEVEKKESGLQLSVVNGDEMIVLEKAVFKNDTAHVRFPYFNSELVFVVDSKKQISGYWQNFNKGAKYTIPFAAQKSKSDRFRTEKKEETMNVDGRWKVAFEPGTDSEYPAVGIFNQFDKTVTGTFLTETGDYRYLAGNVRGDSLNLSCFDGSHAFLFKAVMQGDSLKGRFFSGNHWESNWTAKRNEAFELASPEDLTFLKEGQQVTFKLENLEGNAVQFPNAELEGKVIIIQIMGTWCPNCLDETMYYKSLVEKYGARGLEIVSVCYEAGDSFEQYVTNIERLREKLSLDEFNFLVGGNASKSLASEHFHMLNDIISFPTSIFIGRDGEVMRVHTGFNGPGTGVYYTEYVEKTNALVEFMLAQ